MGSTGLEVKDWVKTSSIPGGGLRESICEGGGSPWWPEDHHKGGGVGLWSAQQGVCLPCSQLWVAMGATTKITKINGSWNLEGELVGNK